MATMFKLSIVLILCVSVESRLSVDYYSYSCPNALRIVHDVVVEAIRNETRMGASLLRLHFHDCFVNVSVSVFGSFF